MLDLHDNQVHESMILVDGSDVSPVDETEVSIPEQSTANEVEEIREELNEKIEKFVHSQEEIYEKEKSKEEKELEEALMNLKKMVTIFIIPFVASILGRKLSVYLWRFAKRYI
ncbi:hypothetical protein QEN19_001924 [Hanseniaspora menglaensis]